MESRWARKKSSGQAPLRLARGCAISCSRTGASSTFTAGIGARGEALREAWWATFERYRSQYPELADHGYRMLRRELPDVWDSGLPVFPADRKGIATRDASGQALNVLARNVPWLVGGSADLGAIVQDAPEL